MSPHESGHGSTSPSPKLLEASTLRLSFSNTCLARSIGLPVPTTAIVRVDQPLVEYSPALNIQLVNNAIPCQPRPQFGSKYVVSPLEGRVLDYLAPAMLGRVRNLHTFAGILVLDRWAGNTDGRQAAFWRRNRERMYTAGEMLSKDRN